MSEKKCPHGVRWLDPCQQCPHSTAMPPWDNRDAPAVPAAPQPETGEERTPFNATGDPDDVPPIDARAMMEQNVRLFNRNQEIQAEVERLRSRPVSEERIHVSDRSRPVVEAPALSEDERRIVRRFLVDMAQDEDRADIAFVLTKAMHLALYASPAPPPDAEKLVAEALHSWCVPRRGRRGQVKRLGQLVDNDEFLSLARHIVAALGRTRRTVDVPPKPEHKGREWA